MEFYLFIYLIKIPFSTGAKVWTAIECDLTFYIEVPVLADLQELIYITFVWRLDIVWVTCR